MNSMREGLLNLESWLHWLPDPVVAIVSMLLAGVIAYSLHKNARKAPRHLLAVRHRYVLSVFTKMRGVTQLGLLILAMIIATRVAPFNPNTAAWMARSLLITVIGLI